jgi:UDP-glucose 4-epimerase
MRSMVIGGCGFIGSHLVDQLVKRGPVTVLDDLSNGKIDFIGTHVMSGAVAFLDGDALALHTAPPIMRGHDVIFHLAANPEARHGLTNPRLDLEQGTIVTHNVLEAARQAGVKDVVFASSGTVYGDTEIVCSETDVGLPTSLYGASKLAGEAMLSAYVECFGLRGYICRFGNVVGPRATHGCILDFAKQLAAHPDRLDVLGDGAQAKPYVHVSEVVAAMLHVFNHGPEKLSVYNVAPDSVTTVQHIAETCAARTGASVTYAGGRSGWPGDVPRSRMSGYKLAMAGWLPTMTSDEAVNRAIGEIFGERGQR